jgi:hypothetical protein
MVAMGFARQRQILDTVERGCRIVDAMEATGHDDTAGV